METWEQFGAGRLEGLSGVSAAYLFCVCGWSAPPVAGESGVEAGTPMSLLAHRGLTAMWSTVPLAQWTGTEGEAHMTDLKWVSPRACRHHEVLRMALRHAPVYPVRFGTLFSSSEKIGEMLERRYPMLVSYLRYVEDKEEWSVKLFSDTSKRLREAQGEGASSVSSSNGASYLRRKQAEGKLAEEMRCRVSREADLMMAELLALAVEAKPRRVQPDAICGGNVELVDHRAFLVQRSRRLAFLEAAQDANRHTAREGLVCEVSGPWPPYGFTDLTR